MFSLGWPAIPLSPPPGGFHGAGCGPQNLPGCALSDSILEYHMLEKAAHRLVLAVRPDEAF